MGARRFGDYELLKRIGRDGPFLMFHARHSRLSRYATLKVLPAQARSLERVELLRREAEVADKLDHPGVVRVFERGEATGSPYLAQAHVDGQRLVERLAQSALPPRIALDLTRQMAEAVAHAHERGVLHGSLRPEIVWLTRDGQARLAGFGCPVLSENLEAEGAANWAGYLAPEQAGGRGAVGPATDVHGLGALLFAMVTGGPPHHGSSVAETCRLIRTHPVIRPSRLHPGLSEAIDTICLKCLRVAPARRYGPDRPLTRLIAELRRADTGRSEPEHGFERWLRRHTRLVRAVVLLLAFAAVPAGWDSLRHRAAWEVLSDAQSARERRESAVRYFERRATEEPFARENIAGLELARLRRGQALIVPASWRHVGSSWEAIVSLTRILAAAQRGRLAEARTALQAAERAGYVPENEIERRLFQECKDALPGRR